MNKAKSSADAPAKLTADQGWRETVESIAMAIILALLFRGFVAEAFVIPTGSMAPTLQGRHKDVACPQCGKWYQASASDELNRDGSLNGVHVTATTCPICRFTQRLDLYGNANHASFSGDRIIVGKFAYDLAEPQRWDVIVFKFPGDARENYIKRLVFLPGELGHIMGGNVYATRTRQEEDLAICRKPPHKLDAMLQMVDDTDFIPPLLTQLGWPARWREWSPTGKIAQAAWKTTDGGHTFTCDGTASGEAMLRYRHLVPSWDDWRHMSIEKKLPAGVADRRGELIADFYAYNAKHSIQQHSVATSSLQPGTYHPEDYDFSAPGPGDPPEPQTLGVHWVDDLAVECVAEVTGNEGELLLDLVRAGIHHTCRIDLADGKATLSMKSHAGQAISFLGDDGQEAASPTAATAVKGPGKYRLRLTNCDHEVLLWVNGRVVPFDAPTTYDSDDLVNPVWTPTDFGDLEPAGIGSRGAAVKLSSLRIYRDKYYIAISDEVGRDGNDYRESFATSGSANHWEDNEAENIQRILANPDLWSTTSLFESRRWVQFQLEEDQFFPMGDNSPYSYDARLWPPPHCVKRDLLIGKALLIYWPHSWNRPIPFTPNFSRMGRIR